MNLSINQKQNIIYFTLATIVSLITVYSYRTIENRWILFRNGEIKYANHEFEAAADLFKQSLEAGVTSPKVSLDLANTYVAAGRFSEAIPYFKDYLSAYPKDKEARLSFAKALSWIGNTTESEAEYQKILKETGESNKQN